MAYCISQVHPHNVCNMVIPEMVEQNGYCVTQFFDVLPLTSTHMMQSNEYVGFAWSKALEP